MSFKQEEIVHLLVTIFSEWVFKAAGVCGSNYSALVHCNEGTCHPVQHYGSLMCLLVFGQQWNTMAQMNKMYQALATHRQYLLAGSIHFGLVIQ